MALEADFDEEFLQRRLAQLAAAHPEHADLVRDLLMSLDYGRATVRNRTSMRNMVFALGSKACHAT